MNRSVLYIEHHTHHSVTFHSSTSKTTFLSICLPTYLPTQDPLQLFVQDYQLQITRISSNDILRGTVFLKYSENMRGTHVRRSPKASPARRMESLDLQLHYAPIHTTNVRNSVPERWTSCAALVPGSCHREPINYQ